MLKWSCSILGVHYDVSAVSRDESSCDGHGARTSPAVHVCHKPLIAFTGLWDIVLKDRIAYNIRIFVAVIMLNNI